ncbi:MAG: molybdenum cofactor biosynthesis protein [Chloroflexi bacterium RBG_13_68_17]|nr:MAG: molybdenum cofactor biosynthesis protein [Chloroflexi bacterium RBG_13_68_17]
MRVALLTVSDRSARGEREDLSGPLLRQALEAQHWTVVRSGVVADDPESIGAAIAGWADSKEVDLILTTGGTGFAPRDCTPEATRAVIEREAPGLAEAMRLAGSRHTPHAMLSRAVAGIRGRTLIVNLPGSPKGARQGLDTLLPVLPHAIALLTEQADAEQGHAPPARTKT